MVFVLNQNKKGLWLLNKKCVIIDQFSHWSQQVYHSYSETCQVFESDLSQQAARVNFQLGQSVTVAQVIHHYWKSLLFLYDVELHGGHTKFYQSFQPI